MSVALDMERRTAGKRMPAPRSGVCTRDRASSMNRPFRRGDFDSKLRACDGCYHRAAGRCGPWKGAHTMTDEGGLRNISDTAHWVAFYRALESERPDALFRDPFARRLAGERGARITEGKAF